LLLSQILVNQQITAFPPNFIHSLDSSHMMMTALACRKAGLNFAGALIPFQMVYALLIVCGQLLTPPPKKKDSKFSLRFPPYDCRSS